MLVLPKHHTPLRNAVISILRPSVHLGHLYGANQIADILNAAADAKSINATGLLRAFANDAADAFVIPCHHSVLYVRRSKTSGRHGGNELAIGRFLMMDEGERAAVVRWRVDIDDDARSGLLQYLWSRTNRKKVAAAMTPDPGYCIIFGLG